MAECQLPVGWTLRVQIPFPAQLYQAVGVVGRLPFSFGHMAWALLAKSGKLSI